MIRTIWVALNLLVSTLPLSLIAIIAALFGVKGRVYDLVGRTWSHWQLWAAGVSVRAEGLEHLTPDRAQIVVANHQSWYDVFALASLMKGPFRFVAKKELERVPIWGRAWRVAGHISVDRGDTASAIRSLEAAGALIRAQGATVVIFPEGTRAPGDRLLPFKKGAFMLALHTQVPIVPAGVRGGHDIMHKNDWRVRSGEIIVRFGEAIPTESYTLADRDALMDRVRAEVERLRSPVPKPDGVDVGDR